WLADASWEPFTFKKDDNHSQVAVPQATLDITRGDVVTSGGITRGSFTVNVFDRETQPGTFVPVVGGTGYYDFSGINPVTKYDLAFSINGTTYEETYSTTRTEGQSVLSTSATRDITIDPANGYWLRPPCVDFPCATTPWGSIYFPSICPPPIFVEVNPGS